MKKILLALALTLGMGVAAAADLSSVGSTGVEATVDYSYARSIGTPSYLAEHQALAGVQVNAGALGSFGLEAGDTQLVTNYRLNFTTFALGYANGFKVGSLSVVGNVNYLVATQDKWFFSGRNGSASIDEVIGTVEVNAPITSSVKLFADYSHAYAWVPALSAGGLTSNGASLGAYVNLSKSVVAKAGYTRDWTAGNAQGLLASLSYKF